MNSVKKFNIYSFNNFNETAIEIFHYQYKFNNIYHKYIDNLSVNIKNIKHFKQIPFLPIEFFKTNKIITGESAEIDIIFKSSGTTGLQVSKHYVTDISVYKENFFKGFEYFYGSITDYCIIALMPSYIERKDSSLIFMVNGLIEKSNHAESSFYQNDNKLIKKLEELSYKGEKTILFGLNFALLNIAEKYNLTLSDIIIIETGGMKGRRKELVRQELYNILCKGFGVASIHSEYGMTELLSQAYSKKDGRFYCPPQMKVIIRDMNDPFTIIDNEQHGCINIVDLANFNSCSFIATQDIGKQYDDGSLEVLGRFDNSDIRGCNLMIS